MLQPPDWSTYSYDAVKLVAAARRAGGPLLDALDATVITGANGDERGYGPTDREGVSPDDMYFGRFQDMRFAPVGDDVLSTNLPTCRSRGRAPVEVAGCAAATPPAADARDLAGAFEVEEPPEEVLPPTWNVAPTDPVYAVLERHGVRALRVLRWGLVPSWAKDAKGGARLINARARDRGGQARLPQRPTPAAAASCRPTATTSGRPGDGRASSPGT